MLPIWREEPIGKQHDRGAFDCGDETLLAAGRRCLLVAAQAGGVALLIDAKNERVAEWYANHGAVPLLDAHLSLLLPFKTIHVALVTAGKL